MIRLRRDDDWTMKGAAREQRREGFGR